MMFGVVRKGRMNYDTHVYGTQGGWSWYSHSSYGRYIYQVQDTTNWSSGKWTMSGSSALNTWWPRNSGAAYHVDSGNYFRIIIDADQRYIQLDVPSKPSVGYARCNNIHPMYFKQGLAAVWSNAYNNMNGYIYKTEVKKL